MNALVFGSLSALPVAGLMAFRLARLRDRMDQRALRTFLIKSSVFLGLSVLISGTLFAFKGSFALPIVWVLLIEIAGAMLLIGIIRKGE